MIGVAFTGRAAAQTYPSRQIRMIIPAGPGGGGDTIARSLGSALSPVKWAKVTSTLNLKGP